MIGPRVGIRCGPKVGLASGVGADPVGGSDFIDVLLWAQSNAGEKTDSDLITDATVEAQLEATNTGVYMTRRKATTPIDPLVWTSDAGYVAPRTDSATENMGWECACAYRLNQVVPNRFRFFKQWIGSSGMHDHWRTDSLYPTTGGSPNLHGSLIQFARQGDIAIGVPTRGETDALDAADAAAFETDQTNEFTAIRTALGKPNLPFIISKLSDQHNIGVYTQRDVVRAAQVATAGAMSGVTIVSKDGLALLGDGDHQNADSQVTHGNTIADEIMRVLGYSRSDWTVSVAAGTRDATFTYTGTGATPVAHFWNFGDGSTSTSASPSHTYAANGIYSVSCTVTGTNGWQHTKTTDVVAIVPTWTVDATSGWAYPANDTEWNAWRTANIGPSPTARGRNWVIPRSYFTFQMASGNAVDAGAGGITLTANGTGIAYQQAFAGHTRLCVTFTDASANARFRSTQAALPDIGAQTVTRYTVVVTTTDPAAVRAIGGMGNPTTSEIRLAAGRVIRAQCGSQSQTQLADNGTAATTILSVLANVSANTAKQTVYLNDEKIGPTANGTVSSSGGKLYDVGATVGATTSFGGGVTYDARIDDWKPESDTDARNWLESLGITVTGYGS